MTWIKRHAPLQPILILTVILVIACTAIGVGLPFYLSSSRSSELLMRDLATQVAKSTEERALRYLHSAPPLTEMLSEMAEGGDLNMQDEARVLDICIDAKRSFSNFAWVSFAAANGSFFAAYEDESGLLVTKRKIVGAETEVENFKVEDKNLVSIGTEKSDYDPRKRPFWKDALQTPQGSWTKPYHMYTTNEPAIAYVRPLYVGDQLMGMWIIEYTTGDLSQFLTLQKKMIGIDTTLYSEGGEVVAKSEGIATKDNNFVYEQVFPKEESIPWKIVTIIPKERFFAPIQKQARDAIILSIGLSLLFGTIGAVFFGSISKKLKEIAFEMHEIGNFRFTEKFFTSRPSFVNEVNMMSIACDRMKIGLGSFVKYVPMNLIQNLIQSGQIAQLSGKKVEMSCLFSDIIGFTDLSEKLSAEMLLEILGEYLTEMGDVIDHHRGQVDKFVGDSIMAIWGAPEPLVNHAYMACLTSLAMQKKLAELREKWDREEKPKLYQRIGINTGLMAVGNIGSPKRMEYTAIGDPVNLASRLEGLNRYYGTSILVGEACADQVMEDMLLRPLDWVSVKGKLQPVLIYELICKREDADEATLKGVVQYSLGLQAYRDRNFKLAKEYFEKALKDQPTRMMLERCDLYLQNPPPADWKGVTIMTQK